MLHINTKVIDAYNNGHTIPSIITDHTGETAFRLKWVNSDGWRGYYEATPLKKSGWRKYDYDGWVTGNWDDAPIEAREDTVQENLERIAKENPNAEIEAVFVLTSNVFSTAFDVFIKEKK